jgi:hypothetical protein
MHWRRFALIAGCLSGIAIFVYFIVGVWKLIEAGGPVGVHQRGVANELASLEREYSTPRTWREAWRSMEILEFAQSYYVPGPGYRGSAESEAMLEDQRERTRMAIAGGLRAFTGQDFGTDADKWRRWLTEQGHADGR